MKVLGDALGRLAGGGLTASVETTFHGDLEKIRLAYNETVGRMQSIVARPRAASTAPQRATGEILSAASDLATRTTRQAAAVEETSAALEQLSVTVGENAGRASAASARAQQVSDTAVEASGAMREANDAMAHIAASSTRISDLIGLLDDIAFQTNLLALNALRSRRRGPAMPARASPWSRWRCAGWRSPPPRLRPTSRP